MVGAPSTLAESGVSSSRMYFSGINGCGGR